MACKTSCMTNLFHDLSNKKKGKSTSQRIIETRLKVGSGTLNKKETVSAPLVIVKQSRI